MIRNALLPRRPSVVRGLILIALSVALPLGCGGDPNKPKLGRVSGTVTYNGEPVPKGIVTFVPTDSATGQSATGEIGPDGSYELTTFTQGDGAVLGNHLVLVQSMEMDPSIEGGSMPIPDAQGNLPIDPPKYLVPAKYSSTSTTDLNVTVESGRNTHDLALTD